MERKISKKTAKKAKETVLVNDGRNNVSLTLSNIEVTKNIEMFWLITLQKKIFI